MYQPVKFVVKKNMKINIVLNHCSHCKKEIIGDVQGGSVNPDINLCEDCIACGLDSYYRAMDED